jgi:acetyl-CoA carboxylase biotin carboxyl carrier protein
MTEASDELEGVETAIRDLVPDLTERLGRFGLGEIEVRRGDLRVRVTRGAAIGPDATPADPAPGAGTAPAATHGRAPDTAQSGAPGGGHPVNAPAVGYFVYGEGLGPGLAVEKGDPLGYVEVLGVRHDVRAPRSGTVRNLVTETGEAVEYGQVLIELEAPAS